MANILYFSIKYPTKEMKDCFSRAGHKIHHAESLKGCKDMIQNASIDVLITGYHNGLADNYLEAVELAKEKNLPSVLYDNPNTIELTQGLQTIINSGKYDLAFRESSLATRKNGTNMNYMEFIDALEDYLALSQDHGKGFTCNHINFKRVFDSLYEKMAKCATKEVRAESRGALYTMMQRINK